MSLVLLHGLGQTPADWDGVLAAMGPGKGACCPDLPALLRGREAVYPALYQALSAQLEALPGPLDLGGLSLGAVLALHYALDHPDHVRALALAAPQITMPRRLLAVQDLVFRLLPQRAFGSTGFSKAAFRRLTASMAELDFRHQVPSLRCPVLVVCGAGDRANRRAAQELHSLLPTSALHLLQGADHEVNRDAPQALGALLDAFFTQSTE